MSGYDIAIGGLNASMRAIDTIGNNIANASTEGYHRQETNLTPAYGTQQGDIMIGGGVSVGNLIRKVDNLLEQEILRQNSQLEYTSTQLSTLQTIENAFGEISGENGLNASIDEFFNALSELSAHCGVDDVVYQNNVVSCANAMAGQFRTLGEYLTTLENQIELEAQNAVEEVNIIINSIADLNKNIEQLQSKGSDASNLKDQRDQYIVELSSYLSVTTQQSDNGVVNVTIAGIPVVSGSYATEISIGNTDNETLGIAVAGTGNYSANNVNGGKISGYMALVDDTLSSIQESMDDLAKSIIDKVNEYHVQGVGPKGSFTSLTGDLILEEDLSQFDPALTSGSVFFRVTDTDTGEISRYEVDMSLVSPQTLTGLASYITSNVTGVEASYEGSKLSITQSSPNYEFDFSPAVLPEPTSTSYTSASPPDVAVSGIYTGSSNQEFQFKVIGISGEVGNGDLYLEVRGDGGSGDVIATVNIGSGYAAGDEIEVGYGIKIAVSDGELAANDTFNVEVFAQTDTSGLLCATGINTFFSGSSSSDIEINSRISDNPTLIATSLGADFTDNNNVLRMMEVQSEEISDLGSMTIGNYYRKMVTDIGQQLSIKNTQEENVEAMVQNLMTQQSDVSGVDINTEAAKMLTYEQMFQAMSKYLTTVKETLDILMQTI